MSFLHPLLTHKPQQQGTCQCSTLTMQGMLGDIMTGIIECEQMVVANLHYTMADTYTYYIFWN